MKLAVELLLFCGLFTLMVKLAAGNDPLNVLFFYPKDYQERAYELGLADRETVAGKRRRFMIPFVVILLVVLVVIIGLCNRVKEFVPAYLQALLFLEVMNWYDGIVIDRIWVGTSSFWFIEELADMPYLQTWGQVLKKRTILSVIWILLAAVVALLVMAVGALI